MLKWSKLKYEIYYDSKHFFPILIIIIIISTDDGDDDNTVAGLIMYSATLQRVLGKWKSINKLARHTTE